MTDGRLIAVELDPGSVPRGTPEIERERRLAMAELIEEGRLDAAGCSGGRYRLTLSLNDEKLGLALDAEEDGTRRARSVLALPPVRKLVRDYYLVCDSYYAAQRTATAERIAALDRNRRAIHDEASALLQRWLREQITLDLETARRLFTLICAMLWRG